MSNAAIVFTGLFGMTVVFALGLYLGRRMILEESMRHMRSRIRKLPEAHTPIEVAPIYEADDDDEWEWWQDDHPHESTPSYAAEQLAWYEEQAESEQATHRLTRTLERLRRDLEAETSPQPTPTMDDDTFERIVTAIDAADPQNIWPE